MKLIHPDHALKVVLSTAKPLKAVPVPLGEAQGLCLARTVRADRDQPPTDRSAVDGYALRAEDIVGQSVSLRMTGESAAGSPCARRVESGTCIRVLTGAVVPRGANAIVMVEHVRELGQQVVFSSPVAAGANIRRKGEDARKGSIVLSAGALLGPAQIGLCASVGKAQVLVRNRPRVAVLSTGLELCEVAQRVKHHQIRDANGPALCAGVAMAGFGPTARQIIPDDPKKLRQAVRSAIEKCDVLLLTGGVSVGRYDFVPQVVKALGGRIRFHGVSMKPGKPLLYATLGKKHIFCLPGNPISALVGLHLFAIPLMRKLAGLSAEWCRPVLGVPLDKPVSARGQRVQFVLARLIPESIGWRVGALESMGSADLVGGSLADGVIQLDPRRVSPKAGEHVEFIPWRPIW